MVSPWSQLARGAISIREQSDYSDAVAWNSIGQEETAGFVSRRTPGRIPLWCLFPRLHDGEIARIPILGSAATRVGVFRDQIATWSASVRFSGTETSKTGWNDWLGISEDEGSAIMPSRDLQSLYDRERPAKFLARTLTNPRNPQHGGASSKSAGWDEWSLDLWSCLEDLAKRFDRSSSYGDKFSGLNVVDKCTSEILIIVDHHIVVDSERLEVSSDETNHTLEAQVILPERSGLLGPSRGRARTTNRVVVAVTASGVAGHPEQAVEMVKRNHRSLHMTADIAAAHLFLIAASSTILRECEASLDRLAHILESLRGSERREGPGRDHASKVAAIVNELWSRRAQSAVTLERAWSLDDPGYANDELLHHLDQEFGLSRYWQAECRQMSEICRMAGSLADSPPPIAARLTRRMPSTDRLEIMELDRVGGEDSARLADVTDGSPTQSLISRLIGGYRQLAAHSSSRPQPRTRLVELHSFARKDIIFPSIAGRLTASTMMTATSGLLLGLVLGKGSLSSSALSNQGSPFLPPLDVLLLFVSTFAFFFETLVLAHASRRLAFRSVGIATLTERATSVSLFLGQYSFVVALPLVITRLMGQEGTTGHALFLSSVVSVLALVLLIVYCEVIKLGAFSEESTPLVEDGVVLRFRLLSDRHRRCLMAVFHGLTMMLYTGAIFHFYAGVSQTEFLLWAIESLLVIGLLGLTLVGWQLAGTARHEYYEVYEWDLLEAKQRASQMTPRIGAIMSEAWI